MHYLVHAVRRARGDFPQSPMCGPTERLSFGFRVEPNTSIYPSSARRQIRASYWGGHQGLPKKHEGRFLTTTRAANPHLISIFLATKFVKPTLSEGRRCDGTGNKDSGLCEGEH